MQSPQIGSISLDGFKQRYAELLGEGGETFGTVFEGSFEGVEILLRCGGGVTFSMVCWAR